MKSAGQVTFRFSASPSHQQRPQAQRLDGAGLVGHRVAGGASAAAAGPGGTSAASAPPTGRLARTVAHAATAIGRLSVSATGSASRPPTASSSRRRSAGRPRPAAAGSARRRAPAPSRGRRRRVRAGPAGRPPPWRRGWHRRTRASQPRSSSAAGTQRSNWPSSGDSTTSVAASRGTRASAASVCATSGRPASGAYCLGIAVPARVAHAGTRHQGKAARAGASGRTDAGWGANSRIRVPRPTSAHDPCGGLHAASLDRARQALHPAPPARLGRRPAAGPPGRGRQGWPAACWPSSPPSRPTPAAEPTNCRSSTRPARGAVPGLGDAALRHLLARTRTW
jgi:hypothetical protein